MFGTDASASAETLTSIARALRALAGSPEARPAFADGSGTAALVAVLRCSTPAATGAAADACCSLAANGFRAVRRHGRKAICAIPNSIRRLLDLLGPSQDAIVGALICEVLAHLAASKSGCKALAGVLARPVHKPSSKYLALHAAAARALVALVADIRSARRARRASCMRALHALAAGSGTRAVDDAAAAARAVLNEH
ncbi:hypothetical protein WJX81_008132 [Elliptochloris bilobata]|uniref:Uncharacterized protein n=1 Tax=Elliptochloris bilobata TaxID=381761 RepID=A0AAW1RWN4_9CHLO